MKGLLLASVLLLCGCSSVPVKEPVYHPPMPEAVKSVGVDWKVENRDNKAYVMLSWEDSQKLRVYFEDIKRYLLETKAILCYYRKDLNEERCLE